MWLNFFLSICITIQPVLSATISIPTSSNDTTSIFNSTVSDDTYSRNTIDCGSITECHIYCNEDSVCSDMMINANMTSILVIYCTATSSCSSFQLLSPDHSPTTTLRVFCTDDNSCESAEIDLLHAQSAVDVTSFDLICSGILCTALCP